MTTLQVIGFVGGFLVLMYLWIGAFRLADNWDSLKEWHELEERRLPLWLLGLICLLCWPRTDYDNAREEIKRANDGKKKEEPQLSANAPRRSLSEIEEYFRGSRLYNERTLDRPLPKREERVASYYDPYEHARWYEGDDMAIPGMVGGYDRGADRGDESVESERVVPSHRWETYTPPYMETPATSPSPTPCYESSKSDSGVGSDSPGGSGSDSSSGGYDSGGCSGGGE